MTIPDPQMEPQYLRGVIDALDLIASFLAWKEENPESKQTAKDFIKQALSKLDTKVEHKLDEVLGLRFEE